MRSRNPAIWFDVPHAFDILNLLQGRPVFTLSSGIHACRLRSDGKRILVGGLVGGKEMGRGFWDVGIGIGFSVAAASWVSGVLDDTME